MALAQVLIVDDDEITRGILRALLTNEGHSVIEAVDGDACIKAARHSAPDVIILDMNMPKMTGFEVAPVLKSHPQTKSIPILALTGDISTESAEAAHEAGCSGYMTKPIRGEKFIAAVAKLLE